MEQPSSESMQYEVRSQQKDREKLFLDRVCEISGLYHEHAAKAASIVLCGLEQHLVGGEARKLEAELPALVQNLLSECEREAGEKAMRFGRSEFFQRVARDLDMPGRRVGPVVAGVFTAVREQISVGEARDVANQLPEDLKQLWERPHVSSLAPEIEGVAHRRMGDPSQPELRVQRSDSRATNTYKGFLEELMDIGNLEAQEAEAAAVSVLCALEQRISDSEAEDLNAQLPLKLRELLYRCERHPGNPRRFDLNGLYELVADDLQIDIPSTVPLVHFVFCTLRGRVSEGEAADVAGQLPKDIRRLWWGASL